MSIIDLGKAQRIVREKPFVPISKPVDRPVPKPGITPEDVKAILEKGKSFPKMPTPIRDSRSLILSLRWFNRIMGMDVEFEEVKGYGRQVDVVLAREAIATRMKYIGRLSYPCIARLIRPTLCHSMVRSAARRMVGSIFGSGDIPSDEIISSVVRAMTDEQWQMVLTRMKEERTQ